MSQIIEYNFDQIRNFMDGIVTAYKKQQTQLLPFEKWKCLFTQRVLENPKKFRANPSSLGQDIKVAPSGVEMAAIVQQYETEFQKIEMELPIERQGFEKKNLMQRIIQPKAIIPWGNYPTIPGDCDGEKMDVPIWFNTTHKEVVLRPGFAKLNAAYPAVFPLCDDPVHAMLGGVTGAGKSVMLNDLILTAMMEYPPWELELVLADFKLVELTQYANRIPSPHVRLVAATSSTEYALSVFKFLKDEMDSRMQVFTKLGVKNIKEFRAVMGMALPRIVFIADEFVQMYQNIKIAEEQGNTKAMEQKAMIGTSISAYARQGRSMGMHMLLSSQEMDGVLDDQTAGQFDAGIAMRASESVSNSLLGNTAASTIIGHGKAIMNLKKSAKDPTLNTLCWVPLIDDEQSEEDKLSGKLIYLQEQLYELHKVAKECGWERTPDFFDQNATIPRTVFGEHLKYAKGFYDNPDTGTDVRNQVYKMDTFATLPLGPEVAYTKHETTLLHLQRRKQSNLIIHSDETIKIVYIARLLAEGFTMYGGAHTLIVADKAMHMEFGLEEVLKDTATAVYTNDIPTDILSKVATRQEYLKLSQMSVNDNQTCWSPKAVFDYFANLVDPRSKDVAPTLKQMASQVNYDIVSLHCTTGLEDKLTTLFEGHSASMVRAFIAVMMKALNYHKTATTLSGGTFRALVAADFPPLVVWWLGLDEINGFTEYDWKPRVQEYFSNCAQVNVFNIVVCNHWRKVEYLAGYCNYVLECSSKSFFTDVNLPTNININPNSFQIHNRETGERHIVRFFNL